MLLRNSGSAVHKTGSVDTLSPALWQTIKRYRVAAILPEPERLRAVLTQPNRDLAGEIAAIDQRVEELRRE